MRTKQWKFKAMFAKCTLSKQWSGILLRVYIVITFWFTQIVWLYCYLRRLFYPRITSCKANEQRFTHSSSVSERGRNAKRERIAFAYIINLDANRIHPKETATRRFRCWSYQQSVWHSPWGPRGAWGSSQFNSNYRRSMHQILAPEMYVFNFNSCFVSLAAALDTEGIFRVSGSQKEVMELKKTIERGIIDFSGVANDHNVSGVLKLFLRELPSPVFPFSLYNPIIKCVQGLLFFHLLCGINFTADHSGDKGVKAMKALIDTLPPLNKNIIRYLFGTNRWCLIIKNLTLCRIVPQNLATEQR